MTEPEVICDICQVNPATNAETIDTGNQPVGMVSPADKKRQPIRASEEVFWCDHCGHYVVEYGAYRVWAALLKAPNRRLFIESYLSGAPLAI